MTLPAETSDRLQRLLAAMLDGRLSDEQVDDLRLLLRDNPAARRQYVRQTITHAMLQWISEPPGIEPGKRIPEKDGSESDGRETQSDELPALVPTSSPLLGFLGNATHGTVGYFSSGWPLAYLLATAILGAALLIGSIVPVSSPQQVARQSVLPSTFGRGAGGEGSENVTHSRPLVGRITGMVDCQFEKGSGFKVQGSGLPSPAGRGAGGEGGLASKTQDPRPKTLVSLGDTFALASGLMEITYDTGAKVILQGPVTYEVESKYSGYLSLGKLTARLEKKGEKSPNLQISKSPNSSPLFPLPSPLFTIKTPTATVTDLGTEFGVEVSTAGNTTSRVFRGSVQLQAVAVGENTPPIIRVLRENESACVERLAGAPGGGLQITVAPVRNASSGFVREMRHRAAPPRLMHLWTFDSDGEDCIGGSDYRLTFSGSAACDTSDSQIGAGALSGVADARSFATVKTYFPPDSQFTISAWIKTSSGGVNHAIFAWGQRDDNGLSRQFRLGEDPYAGDLIYGQSGFGETWHRVRTSPYEVNNGVWRHVAVTRALHRATLYVDGVTEHDWTSYLLGGEPPTGEVTIGGMTFQPYPFCGKIDDLGYWSASLSVAQVRAIYHLGKHPTTRYGQNDVAALFKLYARGDGQLVCGGRRWTVCSELPDGIPGSLVDRGNGELTLYLDTDAGLAGSAIGPIQKPNP